MYKLRNGIFQNQFKLDRCFRKRKQSCPPVCHWMESIFFVEEGEIVILSYHRRCMCNMGKRVNFLPWPWTDLGKDKERTQNTVIQCLILNFDLDLQLTLVKHRHCTRSHHTWHLCKVICKSHRNSKDIERTRNTVIQCWILDCDLDLEPTLVKHRYCTSSYHTWHLCKVICKSH